MRTRNVLLGTALVGAAVAVGRWSSRPEGRAVDAELFAELNRDRGPGADRFFTGVTELGSLWAAGAAAGVLALAGRRRVAADAFAAAGLTWLAGQGFKRVAGRLRPFETDGVDARFLIAPPRASSWPSSHPAVLSAFATVASRDLGLAPLARLGLDGLGLSVAASRVYVGVHYPSDVTSGLLLGRAVARLFAGRHS